MYAREYYVFRLGRFGPQSGSMTRANDHRTAATTLLAEILISGRYKVNGQ